MKLTYNIPTQTVAFEIGADELVALKAESREHVKALFTETVANMRGQVEALKTDVGIGR